MSRVFGGAGSADDALAIHQAGVREGRKEAEARIQQLEHELAAANQQSARLVRELQDTRAELDHEVTRLQDQAADLHNDLLTAKAERDEARQQAEDWRASAEDLTQRIRELS